MLLVTDWFHAVKWMTYLLPLMNVANQTRETQQPQQTQDLSETHNPQGPSCLIHLWVHASLHNQKDIIHWNGRDEVHHEPGPQVRLLDALGIQDDVRIVLYNDACAEVQHQVHEEKGVGHHVEDDPGRGGLFFEEGDADGDNDQVAHHKEEHRKVPVESANEKKKKIAFHIEKYGVYVHICIFQCNNCLQHAYYILQKYK